MLALIGQKKTQSQKFLENGKRIPVTLIDVKGNTVVAIRTNEKNKYQAVQLGFSMKKNASRAEVGHAKGAKLENAPKFLKEVRILDVSEVLPQVGEVLNPSEVFTPGDIVDISGISKGKGFAGGVKRHGFHGGPKTHGQSDRHRAPGSIGQGTTPGRVYKGKRMAGRMGVDNVTIQNLRIIDITNDGVLVVKGLVPGNIDGFLEVKKVGVDKKYVPLQKTPEQIAEEEALKKAEEEALQEEAEKSAEVEVSKDEEAEEVKTEDVNENSNDENLKEQVEAGDSKTGEQEVVGDDKAEKADLTEDSEGKSSEEEKGESADAEAKADKKDAGK
jgi:large subunit ribosomal protein L3